MRTRRSKPVNYKLTRTNRKRGGSPATATPKASLSGSSGQSAPKKRNRASKEDKEATVVDRDPTPPPPASPAKGKRGRSRAPSARSRLTGMPSSKKSFSVPIKSSEAQSARDRRARTRSITNRNVEAPAKPVSKGKAKETADSTKKGVKSAAGVKKSVASGKGKSKELSGMGSAVNLMHAFFRENRDSVKDFNFFAQQKKLGAMWKVSPLNPKNKTAAENEEDNDENSCTASERPSALQSPSSRANEMYGTTEKPAGGTSFGTTADATAAQSTSEPNILRHRPTAAQPYPDEDPDGIYYLTGSENEDGSKAKSKKKVKEGKFTRHLLKEVAISANRILEESENGVPSDVAAGPSGPAATHEESDTNEEEEASEKGN